MGDNEILLGDNGIYLPVIFWSKFSLPDIKKRERQQVFRMTCLLFIICYNTLQNDGQCLNFFDRGCPTGDKTTHGGIVFKRLPTLKAHMLAQNRKTAVGDNDKLLIGGRIVEHFKTRPDKSLAQAVRHFDGMA